MMLREELRRRLLADRAENLGSEGNMGRGGHRPGAGRKPNGLKIRAVGLARLSPDDLQAQEAITGKLAVPAQDAHQNQTQSKPAIEMNEGMHGRIPSGEAALGSDGLFEAVSTHHEASPGGLSGKRDDKKHVVAIDKRLQPVADLNG